jgi:hypothetical protein
MLKSAGKSASTDFFMGRNGHGNRRGADMLLHDDVASFLADFSEAVLLQKFAQGRSGKRFQITQ